MNRDDRLSDLAMNLDDWHEESSVPFSDGSFWTIGPVSKKRLLMKCSSGEVYNGFCISEQDWLRRRQGLINCPPDSEAPEWAEWKAQDRNGWWHWFSEMPSHQDCNLWLCDGDDVKVGMATFGKSCAGHDWRTTLTRINRDDNTSAPEEDEEFERIKARQEADKPYESDARMLDAQWKEACGMFGLAMSQESRELGKKMSAAFRQINDPEPDGHYQHNYKGIKLDPYRIAKIYNMEGGPREQIMKKTLRFTDKGQTEQQVINEIRSALARWQQMLDEDQ